MTGVEPMVEPRNAHRQSINQKLSDLKGHQSAAIDSLAAVNECLLAIFWRCGVCMLSQRLAKCACFEKLLLLHLNLSWRQWAWAKKLCTNSLWSVCGSGMSGPDSIL